MKEIPKIYLKCDFLKPTSIKGFVQFSGRIMENGEVEIWKIEIEIKELENRKCLKT